MSRVQLALNVSDVDAAVEFYTRLFGVGPAKRRPGYANFAVAEPALKLVLLQSDSAEGRGTGVRGSLNHLGVEVESTDEVAASVARLSAEGLDTVVEDGTTCCYAVQDKVWVHDPDATPWEIIHSPRRHPDCRLLRMSDLVAEHPRPVEAGEPADPADVPVLARLTTLDRFLPVWIIAAMALGIGLGRTFSGLDTTLNRVQVGSVSLPIAVGLLLMMFPVLAKVRYTDLGRVTGDRRLLVSSLVLNWLIGPALMFTLAWLLLPDLPAYRTGLIIVGLARCIAMVLIWNDLSCGDGEAAAVLVAINSVFQIVAFAGLGLLLPADAAGMARALPDKPAREHRHHRRLRARVPRHSTGRRVPHPHHRGAHQRQGLVRDEVPPQDRPCCALRLLFTIVILFALQGKSITDRPLDVARIAVPLLVYFAVMFGGSFALGHRLHLGYPKTATLAFTAAGNNFELAIAVAIGVFGVTSGQALAGVVGPLIEVPVLVGLVYVALAIRRRCYPIN